MIAWFLSTYASRTRRSIGVIPAGEQLFECDKRPRGIMSPRVVRHHQGPGVCAQLPAKWFVFREANNRIGERGRIARLDKQGSLTVDKDLGHLAKPAGHDRLGHSEVFEQFGRRAEVGASIRHWNMRGHENIASIQVSGNRAVRDPADKCRGISAIAVCDDALGWRPQVAGSDEYEVATRARTGQEDSSSENIGPVPGAKRAEETNNCLTGKAELVPQFSTTAPGMKFVYIHPVRINHDPIGGNS